MLLHFLDGVARAARTELDGPGIRVVEDVEQVLVADEAWRGEVHGHS